MTMDMMDFTLKVNTLGTFNVAKQVAQTIAKQEPFTEDGKITWVSHERVAWKPYLFELI